MNHKNKYSVVLCTTIVFFLLSTKSTIAADIQVNNIAALRTNVGASSLDRATVDGYTARGDGGGGEFYWSITSSDDDNGGTVIKPTSVSGSGRWLRDFEGDVLNVKWFGAKGDGSSCYTQVQNAIDSLDGGGTILFPVGIYQINQTLTVPSYCHIVGEGWNSIVASLTDDSTIFKTIDGAEGVQFRNIQIRYADNCDNGSTFQIEGINSTYLKLENVLLKAPVGRQYAGIRTWDGSDSSDSGVAGGWMTHIENCWIVQGVIWLKHSDSRIINNYIWSSEVGSSLPFSIRIDNVGNCHIAGNDIVPSSGEHGGIYLYNSYLNRIDGNFFDGSRDNVTTNWAIYGVDTYWTSMTNNTFWELSDGGIYLEDPHFVTISKNVFYGNNHEDVTTNDDIRIIGQDFNGKGNLIQGNIHYQNDGEKSNPSHAIYVGGPYGCATHIKDNAASGNYASPVFSNDRTSGGSTLSGNSIGSYPMRRAGVLTLSSGSKAFYVSFYPALDLDPRYDELRIQLVRTNNNSDPSVPMVTSLNKNGFWVVFKNNLSYDINLSWSYDTE